MRYARREHDQSELGNRAALYLYIENQLPIGARVSAIIFRAVPADPASQLRIAP